MDPIVRTQLGASFDSDAAGYAAHRPPYPADALDWLVGAGRRDVLDLAAGTGSLTAGLVAAGHRVVAAEPGHKMIQALRRRLSSTPAVRSTAEALPFAPGTFDVVTVATAFHWFDPARAVPVIAAVLKPAGRLSAVWNTRDDSVGWMRELSRLLRDVQPTGLADDWGAGSVSRLAESRYFGPVEYVEFPHTQRVDRDGLLGLVASRSYVIALDSDRRQQLLNRVGDLYDAVSPGTGDLAVPYRTQCWRATAC